EQGDVLERARDALLSRVARTHLLLGLAKKRHRAGLWAINAVNDVEHRAFSGAIGADDGRDFAAIHVEADATDRPHPAEAQMNVLDLEEFALCDGTRVAFAFAHLAEREHRLVTGREHVGAKHRASGMLANRLARLLAGAHAHGAKAVCDVGLLSALRKAIPGCRIDDAVLVDDQEVPAPAGRRQ